MSNENFPHTPIELNLKQKQRILTVSFDDGSSFDLSCEYLRVYSPSAEMRISRERGEVVTGKEGVNIERIKPVGTYAVQFYFDDGHHTGIYSWKTLYELGSNFARNWAEYQGALAKLEQIESEEQYRTLNMLYFVDFATAFRRESEELKVPLSINTVEKLITYLRKRGEVWEKKLGRGEVKVTINRQFATLESRIKSGDEIALVPGAPE